MDVRRVIVIGASAGGLEALTLLLSALSKDLPATILVAMHLAPATPSLLASILTRAAGFPFLEARDGDWLRPSRGYAAPPDRHLLVRDGKLSLWHGPRENHQRPAIDPLFRSAAAEYGAQAIGVVLSGNLADGSAGLWTMQRAGALTAVQSPEDALFPCMPRVALASLRPDRVAPASQLGRWIDRVTRDPIPAERRSTISRRDTPVVCAPNAGHLPWERGKLSMLTCPDCGRAIFDFGAGELVRYACRTGHVYPRALVSPAG